MKKPFRVVRNGFLPIFTLRRGGRFRKLLPVERTEIPAGAVVRPFRIHSERGPCRRTEDLLRRDVVHADRNPQHRRQSDQIRSDVPVVEGAVVGTPVGHHAVDVFEGAGSGQVRDEPSGRPARIGTVVDYCMNLFGQFVGVTFRNLQDRSETFDPVDAGERNRHTAF